MQAGKEKFIGLEWLRFFLGVYLVMYHTLPFYESYTRLDGLVEVNELGFFATSCFFALSGFLLAHVYLDGNRLRERPTSIMPSASPTSTPSTWSAWPAASPWC